jgi:hypothetical protein
MLRACNGTELVKGRATGEEEMYGKKELSLDKLVKVVQTGD